MRTFLFTLTAIIGWSVLNAQPFGPTFPAPFGFIEILIGAGAIWGGKKAYQLNKDRETPH